MVSDSLNVMVYKLPGGRLVWKVGVTWGAAAMSTGAVGQNKNGLDPYEAT
jgi:hypothetical protein